MPPLAELVVADAAGLREWLAVNHAASPGVLLVLGRKGGSVTGLTWEAAVEELLCVGWIDSVAGRRDETRSRAVATAVAMLARGEPPVPQRARPPSA